jgi:hypothetical protein
MKAKTDKILWQEDLKIFENEYKKHMDEFYEYMDINQKDMENKTTKTTSRRIVVKKRSSTSTTPATTRTASPVSIANTSPLGSNAVSDIED